MAHNVLDLLQAWRTGVCEVHGVSSEACGAAKEIETLAGTAAVGASLGGAAAKREGAVLGGAAGFFLGVFLNTLSDDSSQRGTRLRRGMR